MRIIASIGRRLGLFVATLLGASVVIFLIVQALPGDIAQVTLGLSATPEQVEALRQQWGLDRPGIVRYGEWLLGLLHGDLGHSYLTGEPVSSLIAPRLAVTCWLVFLAMPIAVLISIPLGMAAAMWRRRWPGAVVSGLSQAGMALPVFFAAIVLVVVFAVRLGWLPANGYSPLFGRHGFDPGGWASHLVLPVISLVIVQSSLLTRYVRSGFVEVLSEDYLRTARAVGWRRWRGLLRHGSRNAALSVVTVIGLQLGAMLVGVILVEEVFALPGLGRALLNAVAGPDLLVIQGIAMILVLAVLTINLLVDLAYLAIDPRLRQRSSP